MSIRIICSGCQKALRVKDAMAGKKGKCPHCGTVISVPARSAELTQAAPPEREAVATAGPAKTFGKAEESKATQAGPHMSKAFYVTAFCAPFALGLLAGVCVVMQEYARGALPGVQTSARLDSLPASPTLAVGARAEDLVIAIGQVAVVAAVVASLFAFVVLIHFLYTIWSAIQAGPARTTPAKALVFLLIPFFNLYWLFQVIWGWAKDYNAFIARRGIEAPPMREGLALALSIVWVSLPVVLVPYLGLLWSLAYAILLLIFAVNAVDCVNALGDDWGKATAPLSSE